MDSGLTIADIKAELQEIRTARSAIYKSAQSYSRPGLSVTRATLDSLSKRERELLNMLRSDTDGILVYTQLEDSNNSSTGDSTFVSDD